MPRGAPDYSNIRAGEPLHRLDDMAELAARLGAPTIFDRAGDVVWLQSFEHGLQGGTFGTDAAPSAGSLVVDKAIDGAFSIKLDPSSTPNSYVEYRPLVYFFPTGKTGFEVSLSPDADFYFVRFSILAYDGQYQLAANVRYYPDGGLWRVADGNGVYHTVLSSVELQTGPTAWHPFKLVIDTETEKYVRFQIDRFVTDLSDYDLRKSSNTSLAQLEVGVTVFGSASAHAACYFDRFIVTQNEP